MRDMKCCQGNKGIGRETDHNGYKKYAETIIRSRVIWELKYKKIEATRFMCQAGYSAGFIETSHADPLVTSP